MMRGVVHRAERRLDTPGPGELGQRQEQRNDLDTVENLGQEPEGGAHAP